MDIIKLNMGFNKAIKFCALVAITGIFLACTRTPTPHYAQQFFIQNRQNLENLVIMIKRCGGAQAIYANGSSSNEFPESKCSKENIDYRDKIAERLKELHILWVLIEWNKDHTLGDLSFVLSSHPIYILARDRGSSIDYFEKPINKPEVFNAGPNYPLTNYPCQWFFVVFSKN